MTAWRAAIKKKAQRVVNQFLDEKENIAPAPSVRHTVAWVMPDASVGRGTPDAPFMFLNGLDYKTKEV